MSFYDAIRVGASGAADFEVKRSLRFDGEGTHHYLERTPSSAGNRQVCTFSCWTKRSNIGVNHCLASAYSANNNNDNISIILRSLSSGDCSLRVVGYFHNFRITNAAFRDPSAWLHVVVAIDTTQSSADDRIKVYINGVQITSFSTSGNVTQNMNIAFNDTSVHRIGTQSNSLSNTADGYIAEVNFIDGQQLTPASFAETNADTGQWVPIDTSALTFGTNGYRLQFADNSGTTATTLGKDTSGNGNNFTPNNFSVAAGAGNDSLEDTPTNNFCTLNPLKTFGTFTLSNGNMTVAGSARFDSVGTFAVNSGKWFWEITNTDVGIAYNGILNINQFRTAPGAIGAGGVYTQYVYDGTKYRDANPSGASAYGASYTDGDIVGVALNLDDNEITFYKNGTSQGAITIPNDLYTAYLYSDSGSYNYSINFGQRAFTHTPPTGYKALCSANLPDPTILLPNKHFDTFLYTATGSAMSFTSLNFQPSWIWQKRRDSTGGAHFHYLFDAVRGGRKILQSNTTNAESDGPDPNITFTSNGYDMAAYTGGQGNANSGTYVSWNWNGGDTDSATYRVVVVSDSGNKYRFRNSANTATFAQSAVTLDLAEGGTYIFNMDDSTNASHPFSIGTAANGTVYTTGITYFLDGVSKTYSEYTSGFAAATTRRLHITVPASAPQLYYWCSIHSGMGGAINTNSTLGSSNFDGSIQTTVKVNASAGFSIVTYTGTGADATIGHGLGVTPNVAITKKRSGTQDWSVKHSGAASGKVGYLNIRDPFDTSGSGGGIVSDFSSSTTYSVTRYNNSGNYGNVNESSATYVAYVFSGVEGYSKFGSYTGNGSSDGTFVFTGFRPAWLLIKADLSESWYLYDNKRNTFNVVDKEVRADHSYAEGTFTVGDFLSNGFKIRQTDSAVNQSGATYLYFCFAEAPFKNSRAR